MTTSTLPYAVILVGGKQYRVIEGEYLLVDRLPYEEGSTFEPQVLLIGGGGEAKLGDELEGASVTAKVTAHVKGEKIIIGKHRQRVGYRRRNGFRASLSRIDIVSIGGKASRSSRSKTASEG